MSSAHVPNGISWCSPPNSTQRDGTWNASRLLKRNLERCQRGTRVWPQQQCHSTFWSMLAEQRTRDFCWRQRGQPSVVSYLLIVRKSCHAGWCLDYSKTFCLQCTKSCVNCDWHHTWPPNSSCVPQTDSTNATIRHYRFYAAEHAAAGRGAIGLLLHKPAGHGPGHRSPQTCASMIVRPAEKNVAR